MSVEIVKKYHVVAFVVNYILVYDSFENQL